MKNSLETKLGMFVVIVIIAAVVLVETLGGIEVFQGGYHVSALFDTVQDLKVGDSAKMAGVEIGKVDSVVLESTNNKVCVTLKIHNGVQIRTDSTATIKFTGLMGQNFVSIDFGTPGAPLAVDGAMLQSVEQPDLNAVMTKLNDAATGIENFGRSFSGQKIQDLIGPLMDFVKENSGNLSGTITNVENITAQIASGQGTVGKLIYDQSLYNSALNTVTNLQLTVAQARDVISGITNGQGTIGKLVTDDTLYNSTTASMTNLDQILLKINGGQGTVGKLVNDQEFYKNAKLSLQKLDNAADGLEDQGPLSVLGIIANNLF